MASYRFRLKETTYKYLFFIIAILFFLFTIWLNVHVNKYALKVDRWSAMEASIKALLNSGYPYSAIDHMQGRSSDLPALIFIGIPFYLIGDVGYLQSCTFVLLLILIYFYFRSYRVSFWALLTIIFSSVYCYDIYVKSDVLSNFILLLIFVVLSEKNFSNDKKASVIFNAVGSALLIMTRIVSVVALILVLAKRFFVMPARYKRLFIAIFLLVVILFCGLVFMNVGSFDNFMKFNPFYLQNSQLPFLLSLLCIVLAFVYAFRIKGIESLIRNCTLLLLLPVLLSLISKTVAFNGFYNSIINSRFDISYFNLVIPFLIFYMAILFGQSTAVDTE